MKLWKRLALGSALATMIAAPAIADETQGVTDDTIKIGIIGPMTGSAAIFGKSVFGLEALYKQANDNGGINGRKIELVREDSACDPSRGIAAAKKLMAQDKVFMIHGAACSGVALAMKPEIVKDGIPYVIMSAASAAISTPAERNIFHPVPTTVTVANTMVDFVMSRGDITKVAVVAHSDEWGKSNRDPAVARLKEEYGLDPIVDLTLERGQTDATPQVLQVRESGAQAVIGMLYPAEMAIFLRDSFKYGVRPPTFGNMAISLNDARDRVGNPEAASNLFAFSPFAHATDSEEMKEWAALINKYYPDERVENFSYLGMGGTVAVIEALKRAGRDLTRQSFIDAMNDIKDFDTGILSANLTFSPEDHVGLRGGAMSRLGEGGILVLKTWAE